MSEQEEDSQSEEGSEEEQQLPPTNPCFCTFACTGAQKSYQAIFVCRTCCSPEALSCVCEACANHCHANHDELDYLGMANAYCDCSTLTTTKCKIIDASQRDWKLPIGSIDCVSVVPEDNKDYVMDTYSIPELYQNAEGCRSLVEEASNLVKESKETFWLSNDDADKESWCQLEKMAWRILEQNKTLYNLELEESGGAEWWVQVKKNLQVSGSEAVDLHYDKDEELAEKYGLGSFPTLSTVTYLTEGGSTNPTVVFGRTYDQPDDEVISELLVSRPVLGKHLVFDGRLLHGAPNSAELSKSFQMADTQQSSSDVRVTLLVNVWTDRKPAGVHPLDSAIRESLHTTNPQNGLEQASTSFSKQPIEQVVLEEEKDKLNTTSHRIELPFVCKGMTWESEDDESGGLVVVTFPPPPTEGDTVHVRFGPGLQAYLDQPYTEESPPLGVNDTGYEDAYI